jgi:CRP-like cAMP-binding protein
MTDFDNESLERLFGRRQCVSSPAASGCSDKASRPQRVPDLARAAPHGSASRLRRIGRRFIPGVRASFSPKARCFSDVYRCDAIAAEPTRVRACGKAEMLAAIGDSPPTMLALLEQVTHLLRHARAMRELRNIRSADDRVLEHLCLSASKDDAVVSDRPLLEVAEDLGLTHEAYYRALATLARAGTIKRMARTIRLIKSG